MDPQQEVVFRVHVVRDERAKLWASLCLSGLAPETSVLWLLLLLFLLPLDLAPVSRHGVPGGGPVGVPAGVQAGVLVGVPVGVLLSKCKQEKRHQQRTTKTRKESTKESTTHKINNISKKEITHAAEHKRKHGKTDKQSNT